GFGDPGQFFVVNTRNHRYYSKYGISNSLMFVAPMVAERLIEGKLPPFDSPRRVFYLNLNHLALSLVLAFVLYRICGLYTSRRWLSVLYVLIIFYTTFLWNYLRAQNGEIAQVLCFCIFYWFFVRMARRMRDQATLSNALLWGCWAC